MKTRKEWERSEKNLTEFLNVGDRIDEAMFNYIGEVVAPAFWHYGFVQCGEPERHEGSVSFHMTACLVREQYFYLGVLPRFE